MYHLITYPGTKRGSAAHTYLHILRPAVSSSNRQPSKQTKRIAGALATKARVGPKTTNEGHRTGDDPLTSWQILKAPPGEAHYGSLKCVTSPYAQISRLLDHRHCALSSGNFPCKEWQLYRVWWPRVPYIVLTNPAIIFGVVNLAKSCAQVQKLGAESFFLPNAGG